MAAAATSKRIRRLEPVRASSEDQAEIAELSTVLRTNPASDEINYDLVGPHGERHRIPQSVLHGLARIVEVLARGDAVTIVSLGTVMTTQQAADLLNVSRQYLVRLLDESRIPYVRTGKHRRLKIEDVLAYKHRRDLERDAELDQLARITEELGGYDDPEPRR